MSSSSSTPLHSMAPLSDEEKEELDQFLASEATSDETMLLDTLDGYLTAIAIGPTSLRLSEWLAGVWGPSNEDAPAFETTEQAQHILDLILRHMNEIIGSLQNNPDDFGPVFSAFTYPDDSHEYLDGEMWAYGFMQGMALCWSDWQPLFENPAGLDALRPIHLLGVDGTNEEDNVLTRTPEQREALAEQIPASVAAIYRFWLPVRETIHQRQVATSAAVEKLMSGTIHDF